MWPFSHKPKPLNPGPINEDWKAGDLAECIKALASQSGDTTAPSIGDVHRVTDVAPRRAWFGDAWMLNLRGFESRRFYDANGFRKVPPLNSEASAEFVAQIKALKPKFTTRRRAQDLARKVARVGK